MTTIINASTSSGLVFTADQSGTLQFQNNGVNLPMSGVAPAFAAYATASQSITNNTPTKVTLDTEIFDTNNNFASSRFTPTVAGYYQLNGVVRVTGTSLTGAIAEIYKNGSVYCYGQAFDGTSTISAQVVVSEIIYLNGTTDYVELWGYITATSPAFGYAATYINCRFNGCLLRGA